jgi:hypothetical protein
MIKLPAEKAKSLPHSHTNYYRFYFLGILLLRIASGGKRNISAPKELIKVEGTKRDGRNKQVSAQPFSLGLS